MKSDITVTGSIDTKLKKKGKKPTKKLKGKNFISSQEQKIKGNEKK